LIAFCHAGPILLCIDLFVYILCIFVSKCIVVVLLWARWIDLDGIELTS